MAVIVEIADAASRAPPGSRDPRRDRHISKRPVAIVLIQAAHRCIRRGPTAVKSRSVHQKYVEPAIAIVVEERAPAARSLEQVFVSLFTTIDGLRAQPRFASDVYKLHVRFGAGEQLIDGKYRGGTAKGANKRT